MAKPRKRGQWWYARVRIWINKTQKEKETLIPLKTKSEPEMLIRLKKVNEAEPFIKNGTITDFESYFPWLNDGGKSELIRFTLKQAIDEWLSKRRVAPSTVEINRNGLDRFVCLIGEKHSLESITIKQIDEFSDGLEEEGLSKTSINIHLRTVKTMLRYFQERGKINKVPPIKQLRVNHSEPIYITDAEFQSIMAIDRMDDFFKRAFFFYRETGCRLNEPFMGTLSDNWLDIPNTSKGGRERSICLSENLIEIYKELKGWSEGRTNLAKPHELLSKQFKKALRAIGASEDKHFHSLRHTFAVRSLIKGKSIYGVQKEMGHSSVVTTEVYTKMNLKRVECDFPTLVGRFENESKTMFRDTDFRDIDTSNSLFIDGRIMN
jgi:integrase/recombinase XerC